MPKVLYSIIILFYCSGPLFGQQTVGLFLNDSLAFNGYTLFTVNHKTYLIDNCGRLVNTWTSNLDPGLSVYLLEDGQLLRTANRPGDLVGAGGGGRIERYSWEGDLEWSFDYSSTTYRQHHDIEPLPDGNILVLAWEEIPQEEMIAAGRDSAATNKNVWLEHIVEIQPVGTSEGLVVWEWHARDHLIQDRDSSKANYGEVAAHPELIDVNFAAEEGPNFPGISGIDWMHGNGIDYHPDRDEILLSIRNFNEFFIIDHSTNTEEAADHSGGNSGKGGDILYRWGNPMAYQQGDSSDQRFFYQHDARWIPTGYPGEGNIMVFNNGVARPGGAYSSVDVLTPPLDANGHYYLDSNGVYGPSTLSWTYNGGTNFSFYSSIMSGAHPLPNGNTLICVARSARVFEVDPAGTLAWDYIVPVDGHGPVTQGDDPGLQNIFRATRYPPDYPAFEDRDLSPGMPIELDPLPSDCVIYDGTISSLDSTTPLAGVGIHSNPFGDVLQINNHTGQELTVQVIDIAGRVLYSNVSRASSWIIDSAQWPGGLYLLWAKSEKEGRVWVEKVFKN